MGWEGETLENSVRTFSSPAHVWSSSRRCLPQKWPWQKLQSPEIRCASALHSAWEQRIFLDGMVCGVMYFEVRNRGWMDFGVFVELSDTRKSRFSASGELRDIGRKRCKSV